MTEAASPFDLDGQLAIVTGASSGLGRHFALTPARAAPIRSTNWSARSRPSMAARFSCPST